MVFGGSAGAVTMYGRSMSHDYLSGTILLYLGTCIQLIVMSENIIVIVNLPQVLLFLSSAGILYIYRWLEDRQ